MHRPRTGEEFSQFFIAIQQLEITLLSCAPRHQQLEGEDHSPFLDLRRSSGNSYSPALQHENLKMILTKAVI